MSNPGPKCSRTSRTSGTLADVFVSVGQHMCARASCSRRSTLHRRSSPVNQAQLSLDAAEDQLAAAEDSSSGASGTPQAQTPAVTPARRRRRDGRVPVRRERHREHDDAWPGRRLHDDAGAATPGTTTTRTTTPNVGPGTRAPRRAAARTPGKLRLGPPAVGRSRQPDRALGPVTHDREPVRSHRLDGVVTVHFWSAQHDAVAGGNRLGQGRGRRGAELSLRSAQSTLADTKLYAPAGRTRS